MVDTGTQLITAVEVLPGNASDNSGALELVEASEANTGVPVEETMGDAAYGDGDIRQDFADAERTLIARVPGRPDRSHFPKEDFHIDLAAGSCTLSGGTGYPENPALGHSHRTNGTDAPTEGIPVRRTRFRRYLDSRRRGLRAHLIHQLGVVLPHSCERLLKRSIVRCYRLLVSASPHQSSRPDRDHMLPG